MIGISIAAKKEWEAVLDKYQVNIDSCIKYPFGEYFTTEINGKNIIFYRCGVRKTNCSAATQYMIDHFNIKRIIVAGTCAGIDDKFKNLDIFVPNKAVQYDCTVKETEPLIKDSFTVSFDLNSLNFNVLTGTIGTADKPVVMWKDYLELKENGITIADTESASIAYVCKLNKVECIIIKGISDFPTNEQETSKEKSHEEQLNLFLANIPIIMNKIINDYLPYAIENQIHYNDYNYIDININKVPDEIFMNKIKDVDLISSRIHLFSKEEFYDGQNGYRYNKKEMKMIDDWIGEEFFVIGYDSTCGDPIIINIGEKEFPVYSMFHDDWTTLEKISDSFKNYIEILKLLGAANLNYKPSKEKIDELILKIEEVVPEKIEYWKFILNLK